MKMEKTNLLKDTIENLKSEYKLHKNYADYRVFTLLCLKYFFYSNGMPFDAEMACSEITDGPNDGGIDAIINDPNSENNDVIIVQNKYYEQTKLTETDVLDELYKIQDTIKNIESYKVSSISAEVVTAYRNAKSQQEENGCIKIVFFTSYKPKNMRERNKIERFVNNHFKNLDFELFFYEDIEAQIEAIDNGKLCIENDKLLIDETDNYLKYEDSLIVNISARSLQQLQNRRRNGLLGMNLRYYVRQKTVDDGIKRTIDKDPENFWYKNNGIIIICESYKLDGKELRLENFSIINGGQTTDRIGRLDISQDFYLQCKVVKSKGESKEDRDNFAFKIAEATNSQKPIKKSDLKSNTPEQLSLRAKLANEKVYYITKKGDKAPKQYSEPYQITTIEQIGKLSLAAVLQMPGSARSNSQRMYQDEYYYTIFKDAKPKILAQLLKLSHYYDIFTKQHLKNSGFDEITVLPMIKNGKTFQLACILFLEKIIMHVFLYDRIAGLLDNTDALKDCLRRMEGMEYIIADNIENEQDIVFTIFSEIGEKVLGYCFETAQDRATENQTTLSPSDYLKKDTSYYKDIIKRLWRVYNHNSDHDLRDSVLTLCGIKPLESSY